MQIEDMTAQAQMSAAQQLGAGAGAASLGGADGSKAAEKKAADVEEKTVGKKH